MLVKNKRALMENKHHQTLFRVPITKVRLRLDHIYLSISRKKSASTSTMKGASVPHLTLESAQPR